MQYINRLSRFVLVALAITSSYSAMAVGTASGELVNNSVSMTFTAGGVTGQTATAAVDFLVDSKLDLAVTNNDLEWVTAVPGQTQAAGSASSTRFTVSNNSNVSTGIVIAVIDQGLQQVDGFTAVGATAISPTTITVWEDTNDNGVLDGAETALGTSPGVYTLAGTFAEDESRSITISIDVPGATAADSYQTYTLVAAVANAGTVVGNDDSGNISPNGTAANIDDDKDTVQIVFADEFNGSVLGDDEGFSFLAPIGPTTLDDGDSDGQASNASGFRVRVALGIGKSVVVLWDPISGNSFDGAGAKLAASDPKAIPGAILLYVIGVSADSGLDATAVNISDDIADAFVDPGNTTGEAPAGINIPATIDVSINGTDIPFALDAAVSADSNITLEDCSGTVAAPIAFAGSDPEVVVPVGACADGETGYVAYVVTVDDTP